MKLVRIIMSTALIVALAGVATAHGPASPEAQKKHDQLHAAVQGICPVSGNKLGEHGTPIKVKIGQEEIFLCCKGCVNKQVNPKYWAAIHANFAKAQRICPVMKKELPKNPKWTIVKGQIVYVCCPPCAKKLAANPDKYLHDLDALYARSLRERKTTR